MKLELGAGNHPTPDYVHHDETKHDNWIDVAFDLEITPWPLLDEAYEGVLALDVMEHIRPWQLDVSGWLEELWRVLIPYGDLTMRLPAWDNAVSYRDPTHYKVFHEETFDYWDPSSQLHTDYGRYYFPASHWWNVLKVERANGSDLVFHLQKLPPAGLVEAL